MQEKSYRLAYYEIIVDSNGRTWWKSHVGFADIKSGGCFIEGNILFLSPGEQIEPGFFTVKTLHTHAIFSYESCSHGGDAR
jgi:hypothetical protein